MSDQQPPEDDAARREADDARKQADALRKDRERAAKAAAKEAARAERDREKAEREAEKARAVRDRLARNAEKEAERLRAEQERAVREVEREAAQAQREAERAAQDAALAAQRAARQVERVRLRARAAEEPEPDVPELPSGLAVLWRPAPAGRRGPRPGLTLDGIAEAAVALADAEGLGAVSMARVAERVGVTTMALYRYVSSKDDLLALMVDRALAELAADVPGGPDDGWRPALERWCRDQLAVADVHPWVVQPPVTSAVPGPARVALLERGLGALAGTPLTWGERVAIIGRVSLHVLSEGQLRAAGAAARRAAGVDGTGGAAAGAGAEALHPALLDFGTLLRAVTDAGTHPVLATALAAGGFDDVPDPGGEGGDEDLGLRLLLDGVEALVDRARRRADPAAG